MRIVKILLLVALVVFAVAGGYAYLKYQDVTSVGDTAARPGDGATTTVVIAKGSSPKTIAKLLAEKGIIGDADNFALYVSRVAKKAGALQAGEFELSAGMTGDEIIEALSHARKKEVRFTIPEGLRKEEIASIIASAGVAKKADLLRAMKDPALQREFGVPAIGAGGQRGVPGGVEGYLYPDTYQFPKNSDAKVVLRKMRQRLTEVIDAKMKARMDEMDWPLHKVLTLASIVEKETGQAKERPIIASVFLNRMARRPPMKLQTDPTVIYGIKNYDGNIRKRDLLTPHPYNTYTIPGLPPGPIASPGVDAIRAVLWPAKSKYIFFVSKNDGTHIFTSTLAEHEAMVDKWQRQYFRNKRKR